MQTQNVPQSCPECGAGWTGGVTCQDHFYQMLYWENEYPGHGQVHHLMVLSYHLQHPSLYSQAGLAYAVGLLVDMVVNGKTPRQIRSESRRAVDSGSRQWNVTSRRGSPGSYSRPVRWAVTAADVIAAGAENYIRSVQSWAESIYRDLADSQNLPVDLRR